MLKPLDSKKPHYLSVVGTDRSDKTTLKRKIKKTIDRNQSEQIFMTERSLMKSTFQDKDNEQVNRLKERIHELEVQVRTQQKEINRLQQMNEYLIRSNTQKLDMLHSERNSKIKSSGVIFDQNANQNTEQSKPSPNKMSKLVRNSLAVGTLLGSQRVTNKRLTALRVGGQDDQDSQQRNEREKTALNLLSFLHLEECFKINAILNIKLSDSDAVSLYENDGALQVMDKVLQEEEVFIDILQYVGPQKLSFLYDKMRRVLSEHKMLFILILRMKKIIQGALEMSQTVLLDEALSTIVDEIMICLECDRATCFIVDNQKNELWSKIAKGASNTIRMPMNKGIAGHVATSRELLNIQNAYLDQRFNQETDVTNNYKTKTLLVCPIVDNERCIGVLQCVNKLDGHFTKDDEALLWILAEFSKVVLNNAMNHDEQLLIHNKLRHTIKTGLILFQNLDSEVQLLQCAENRLKAVMNVENARIAVLSKDRAKFIYYLENGDRSEVDSTQGIMGECVQVGHIINLFNCYSHTQFNPSIDIQTNLPVVILPIKDPHDRSVLGALQVVNMKGISTMLQQLQPKLSTIDQEVLESFSDQLALAIQLIDKK